MSVITRAANTLGFCSLKKEQEQESSNWRIYRWKGVFVCLPTGFGKSLCFIKLPDLYRAPCDSSIVVAISPLNSLMSD